MAKTGLIFDLSGGQGEFTHIRPLVEALAQFVDYFRISHKLVMASGLKNVVEIIKSLGGAVFYDARLVGEPEEIFAAVRLAADMGIGMITISALANDAMLRSAAEGSKGVAGNSLIMVVGAGVSASLEGKIPDFPNRSCGDFIMDYFGVSGKKYITADSTQKNVRALAYYLKMCGISSMLVAPADVLAVKLDPTGVYPIIVMAKNLPWFGRSIKPWPNTKEIKTKDIEGMKLCSMLAIVDSQELTAEDILVGPADYVVIGEPSESGKIFYRDINEFVASVARLAEIGRAAIAVKD